MHLAVDFLYFIYFCLLSATEARKDIFNFFVYTI